MSLWSLGTLLAILAATECSLAPLPAAGAGGDLPAEECIELLRGARIAGMRGDVEGQKARLLEAFEGFPEEIEPIYALLEFDRAHPLKETEAHELRRSLVARLSDPEAAVSFGALARIARDPEADAEILRSVATALDHFLKHSSEVDALRVRAGLAHRLEEPEVALASLLKAWRLSGDLNLILPIYELYSEAERWPEAARFLEKGIAAGGEVWRDAYLVALAKAGRLDDLVREINRLMEVAAEQDFSTEVVSAYLHSTAWALRDGGRDEEAEAFFRRALELDDKDSEARSALLYLYADAAERERFAATETASLEQEEDPHALLERGTDLVTAGDMAGALPVLRRAAPEFPKLEGVWYNLGLTAYSQEQWQEAADAYRKAAELNPERAESWRFAGLALVRLEQCGEAVELMEQAFFLDPKRNELRYYLSTCYSSLGERAKAASYMEAYRAAKGD